MSLNPDLRLSLLELVHTLEDLLTRPLREQQYKPDLGRVAAVAQLTLGQARHALALDDASHASFEHATPMWCPPEILGHRIRARHLSRQEPEPLSPRRPRA
jgi:hypothetical protein